MAEHMRRRICEQGRYTIPSRIVILAKAIALATIFVVRPKNCQIDILGSSDEEESMKTTSYTPEQIVKMETRPKRGLCGSRLYGRLTL